MSNLTKVALCIAAGVVFKLLARVEPDRAKWASRQFQPVQGDLAGTGQHFALTCPLQCPSTYYRASAVSLNRSHGAPERLSQFIQFKTVSNPDTASHALDAKQFTKAHKFLQSSYPSVYKQLKAEKVPVGGPSWFHNCSKTLLLLTHNLAPQAVRGKLSHLPAWLVTHRRPAHIAWLAGLLTVKAPPADK